ncbi:molybdenum cofactor guanylyltransferase MobA [Celeribacter marinus]|uniref:Molybdenum cofactor guanylyltransferase n=1 Tax=Celeribacter marinus TaxID=1397108 RepID=A0A0P0A9B0_9RHOB|nr:molybdenum cofactor guanylyltransferase MobA [Celeribacter marinus]ALI55161.1 molybdopterin-guanine dinucleotide biosynthesis protein MobA [Celeribacter marinus]SFK08227.1 molybdenum cofactor guanylyltransferase [Celeribacter marinus]
MVQISGLILAGGQARRMGGTEKAFITLDGGPLLTHVIDALRPQCGTLAISSNSPPPLYESFGLPVLADGVPQQQGPLSGILAGLEWAARAGQSQILCVPVDVPFIPDTLVARLTDGATNSGFSVAASSQNEILRHHPVIGVWPVHLRDEIRAALADGDRRVGQFALRHNATIVTFDVEGGIDPFFNINTPQDRIDAEAALKP